MHVKFMNLCVTHACVFFAHFVAVSLQAESRSPPRTKTTNPFESVPGSLQQEQNDRSQDGCSKGTACDDAEKANERERVGARDGTKIPSDF